MKKFLPLVVAFTCLFASCGPASEKAETQAADEAETSTVAALCEFSSIDSATAQSRLVGEWELKGIQTNYMGAQEDKFLTGEQVGTPKSLKFFENGEFEEHVDGQVQAERKAFKVVGQSLPPVGYQFWFCGENTLVVSNIAADGATEVFIKK